LLISWRNELAFERDDLAGLLICRWLLRVVRSGGPGSTGRDAPRGQPGERGREVAGPGPVLVDEGRLLASRRIPEGVEGLARLHAVLAEQVEDPAQVLVGVETDRGLLVGGPRSESVGRWRSLPLLGCDQPGRAAPDPIDASDRRGCLAAW
jgi:hypothetical protein